MDELVNDFNTLAFQFASEMSKIAPNSILSNNLDILERTMKSGLTRRKIIDYFVCNVLQYKSQIESGDEKFFMEELDFSRHCDNSKMKNIFEFKSIWKTISDQNKDIVKQYMIALMDISEEYFMLTCGQNQ